MAKNFNERSVEGQTLLNSIDRLPYAHKFSRMPNRARFPVGAPVDTTLARVLEVPEAIRPMTVVLAPDRDYLPNDLGPDDMDEDGPDGSD